MMRKLLCAGLFLTVIVAVMVVATRAPAHEGPRQEAALATTFVPEPLPILPLLTDRLPAVPAPAGMTLRPLPAGIRPWTAPPAGAARPLRTNKWWTGGITDTWPAPAFALPLRVGFGVDGLNISVPSLKTLEKAVISEIRDPIRLHVATPAVGARAVSAGDWDVTFRMLAAAHTLQFDVTLAEGSPFAFVRSRQEILVELPGSAVTKVQDCTGRCGSALLVTLPDTRYLLASSDKKAFTVQGGTVRAATAESGFVTVAAVAPDSDPVAYLAAAMRPYAGTRATFSVSAARVRTTFRFPRDTVTGLFPHQTDALEKKPGAAIGTFPTIRGPLTLYALRSFSTSLARPMVLPALPPTQATRDVTWREGLAKEIAEDKPLVGDIYGAAKNLLRKAMLAELADSAGDGALRDRAVAQTRTHLSDWCDGTGQGSFAYDRAAGGIIALPQAFGSELYNDHHFHYGYFLHAAAIVQRFDPSFDAARGDCMRLLARDIASARRDDPSFPPMRYFDPYAGHSWAGGVTPFGDGNNQESVSEAAHAWYGMALYGHATGDKALEELGIWLFTEESHAGRVYWFNTKPALGTIPSDFTQPMFSLIWGGKADYATFFDGSDAAIRGIQVFPTTPSLIPLLDDATVSRVISPARAAAGNTIWTTTHRMAEALFRPTDVPADAQFDPGLSASYARAWAGTFRALGAPAGTIQGCQGGIFRLGNVLTAAVYREAKDPAQCTGTADNRTFRLTGLPLGWTVRRL